MLTLAYIYSINSQKVLQNITTIMKPGIQRVQALADISRSALCCHSNETRAPIANPPNSAQLKGTPCHSSNLHPGPCSGWECGEGQTDTQMVVTTIHFASREM